MKNKLVIKIGVLPLLGLLFIGLKLGGVINWSWWLVTLPIWGIASLLGVLLLALIFIAILATCANRRQYE